jgi:hypothetical protein
MSLVVGVSNEIIGFVGEPVIPIFVPAVRVAVVPVGPV